MRRAVAGLTVLALLAGCHTSLRGATPQADAGHAPSSSTTVATARGGVPAELADLGPGAAPGNAKGPGGFVARGSRRNFYTAAGGRLWYYLNNYYWAPPSLPRDDLWIRAEVVERIRDLRRWPDGRSVPGPAPKVTLEYWEVGPKGRSVRLDNHKDFCLLSQQLTAGAITVEVTLTLGRLRVLGDEGAWGPAEEAYVLAARNYSGGGGIGADRVHFEPLPSQAVTVWRYRIPWSSHPQRFTRSNWRKLRVPEWKRVERRRPLPVPVFPPGAPPATPPVDGG